MSTLQQNPSSPYHTQVDMTGAANVPPPAYSSFPPPKVSSSQVPSPEPKNTSITCRSFCEFLFKATLSLAVYFSLTVVLAHIVQAIDHNLLHHNPSNYSTTWHPYTKPLFGTDGTYMLIGYILASGPPGIITLILWLCTDIETTVFPNCGGACGSCYCSDSSCGGDGGEVVLGLGIVVFFLLLPAITLCIYYWAIGLLLDRWILASSNKDSR